MTIRVLLVEDLPQVQAVVQDLLASLGDFQIAQVASTEAEANLWLDENPKGWDLAVIDLVLEQGTGMGVVARARNRSPASKVVVFSDFATNGIRSHCLKLGADVAFRKGDDIRAFIDYCAALAPELPRG